MHNPGELNTDAGPDFSGGHVTIGDFSWHGAIEIHLKSSDWILHKHQFDPAYERVILHVVYHNDREIFLRTEGDLPVVELKPHIDLKYIKNYKALRERKLERPCRLELPDVSELLWTNWKDRLLLTRLERKCLLVEELLFRFKNDWNNVAWHLVCRSFGLKVNKQAFEQLAVAVPSSILKRCSNSTFQLEALLFGQAGLLPDLPASSYETALINEYAFLRHKYKLVPMSRSQWKKLRMRPTNFPEIRIAQLAAMAYQNTECMSMFLDADTMKMVMKGLRVEASPYWNVHFSFGEPTVEKRKKVGMATAESIIINAVVPMLFFYGKTRSNQAIADKAIRFLDELPSEKNKVIQGWKTDGITVQNAGDSQALLELNNEFCDRKKCLSCMIGVKLLKRRS